jgi:hypothetical protein
MKRVRRMALAVALTGAVIGIAAPAASADTPGCVTRSEFSRVRNGMTQQQVARIYDTGGHVSVRSGPFVIRNYRTCAQWHVTNVSFWGGEVDGKLYI